MTDAWWYAVWFDPRSRSRSRALESWKFFHFKSYLLRHLQWELATDHWFLNYGIIPKFDRVGFLIFVLVFVSRDCEPGRNVSCEESRTGLIYFRCRPNEKCNYSTNSNTSIITLAASSGKRNVAVWSPSVRLFVPSVSKPRRILNATHQRAARAATSVHFSTTTTMIDILVISVDQQTRRI